MNNRINKSTGKNYFNNPKYTKEQFNNLANCITSILSSVKTDIAASHQFNNKKNKIKEIKAFAKLSGNDWTYFVKSLKVSIGRNTDNIESLKLLRKTTQDDIINDANSTNIDLGPAKTVSRRHASIEFNRETGDWELIILGRNGAKLNYKKYKGNSPNRRIVLKSGDIIDIGGVQMIFILPDQTPVIHSDCLKEMIPDLITIYGLNGNNNPLLQDIIRDSNYINDHMNLRLDLQNIPMVDSISSNDNWKRDAYNKDKKPKRQNPLKSVDDLQSDYNSDDSSTSSHAKADETIQLANTTTDAYDQEADDTKADEQQEEDTLKRPLSEDNYSRKTCSKKFKIVSIASNKQYGTTISKIKPTLTTSSNIASDFTTDNQKPNIQSRSSSIPETNNFKKSTSSGSRLSSRKVIPPLGPRSESKNNKKQPEDIKSDSLTTEIEATEENSTKTIINKDSIKKEKTPNGNDTDSTKNNRTPLAYGTAITQAILSTDDGIMSLSEIYQYMMTNYEYFRTTKSNWQNSVRHTLSLNSAFSKLPKKKLSSSGKGMVWCIDKNYREEFLSKWKLGIASKSKKNAAVDKQLIIHMSNYQCLPEPYDNEIRPNDVMTQDMTMARGMASDILKLSPQRR
ncbi:Forkhead box protein N4 [Maudiozyma exigua]|uniref:Forkhead box protein N4 n=1 Tax=Maudiozyma exigua TaxID=34358 RepID=A0A9P6WB54_MAUEX|nr:Forkhead box protein N4 [Kazachstania exigua]